MTKVKLCGLKTPNDFSTAINAGADFAGFVFFPPSPRHVTTDDVQRCLAAENHNQENNIEKVGLFVNPHPALVTEVLRAVELDMIQLHGTESPEDVARIKDASQKPVIKAFPISAPEDLGPVQTYEGIADWFLFDAKPDENSKTSLPGGTGHAFDWGILKDYSSATPWMLAGGLQADNVAKALSILSPDAVDVSSGIEDKPGMKNKDKIIKFVETVHKL